MLKENRYFTEYKPSSHPLSDEEKVKAIAEYFSEIMEILGLDLENPSLADTPNRIGRMYVEELFYGLKEDKVPKLSFIEENCYDGNVVEIKNIEIKSTCEHHFLPIIGTADVSYIPNGRIIGLSKINRIVAYFSHRPQLQERLTAQIADFLSLVLNTQDIAVTISAAHCCVTVRGIEDTDSLTTTKIAKGKFSDLGVS